MIRKPLATAALVTMAAGTLITAAPAHALPATNHQPATRVTTADLPTATDLRFPGIVFHAGGTDRGEGQAPTSVCQTRTWAASHPTASFVRDYSAVANRSTVGSATASIASFRTHAQALAAARNVASGFTGCSARFLATQPRGTEVHSSLRTITLTGGQKATVFSLNSQAPGQDAMLEEAGVVVTGTHAEIVATHLDHMQALFGTTEITTTLAHGVRTLA